MYSTRIIERNVERVEQQFGIKLKRYDVSTVLQAREELAAIRDDNGQLKRPLKKAEQELLKEREKKSTEATVILSKNYDIDCGPTGKVTCPVCSGSTVVIKKTYLGDSYKTCTFCKKLGYLTCEDYNKMLRGELKANQ